MSSIASANHEYEPVTASDTPTRNPEHGTPEPATRQEHRALELLHETYGDAFQCYLTHVWEGCPVPEIEENFQNLYWGTYPDRKAYMDSVIDGLGWQEGYEELVTKTGIPPELLNWNYPLLLAHLQEDRELIDSGGSVHVFLK